MTSIKNLLTYVWVAWTILAAPSDGLSITWWSNQWWVNNEIAAVIGTHTSTSCETGPTRPWQEVEALIESTFWSRASGAFIHRDNTITLWVIVERLLAHPKNKSIDPQNISGWSTINVFVEESLVPFIDEELLDRYVEFEWEQTTTTSVSSPEPKSEPTSAPVLAFINCP
jgi:hypothetical protein